jgi:hypothetical protein
MTRIDTAALAGRLRAHARRAKNEPGYRTPGGMPRAAFAANLRRWARRTARGDNIDAIRLLLIELDEANK